MSGVSPVAIRVFGFAPALSRSSTSAALPFVQARDSGVMPKSFARLASARARISRSAVATSFQCAAHRSAVDPSSASDVHVGLAREQRADSRLVLRPGRVDEPEIVGRGRGAGHGQQRHQARRGDENPFLSGAHRRSFLDRQARSRPAGPVRDRQRYFITAARPGLDYAAMSSRTLSLLVLLLVVFAGGRLAMSQQSSATPARPDVPAQRPRHARDDRRRRQGRRQRDGPVRCRGRTGPRTTAATASSSAPLPASLPNRRIACSSSAAAACRAAGHAHTGGELHPAAQRRQLRPLAGRRVDAIRAGTTSSTSLTATAGSSSRGSSTTSCSSGRTACRSIPYDPERHVWLVDDGAHSIYKFTNDGKKLVMTLGEFKVPGDDERHFGRPTEIAWLPDGTFFVSDGYTNTRVVKFDRNGKFLMTWGMKGNEPIETRPGYMNTVHAIAIDAKRRVYVSDRANSRVQVFDENGKFLDVWPGIRRPYSFLMSADQHLWIADGNTQKMPEIRPERPAALLVGHLRPVPRRLLGRAPVQRGQRRQSLHRRCAHRSSAEVPPEAWRQPRSTRRRTCAARGA